MRELVISLILPLAALLLITDVVQASQEQRLALLIGNSHYTHGGSLDNPVNDVRT